MRISVFTIHMLCISSLLQANTINIHLCSRAPQESVSRAYFVPKRFELSDLQEASQHCQFLPKLVEQRAFAGDSKSILLASHEQSDVIANVMVVGLGKPVRGQTTLELEAFRRAVAHMVRETEKQHITDILVTLPDPALFGTTYFELAKELGIIAEMTQYKFDYFLSDNKEHDLTINLVSQEHDAAQDGLREGLVIGRATNSARYWVDMPANVCNPSYMSANADRIAQEHGLKAVIFGEQEIKELGMGGLEAVSRGSSEECQFVVLQYHYADDAPTIALAGKGVTHDAGGLNIKLHMQEIMKMDMGGAAAVLGAMQAIAQLKPKVNVVALMPFTENLLGDNAYRPGDVLRFYNGKTAEILNTDAEGRLILADALSYGIATYKPDVIVDLATLTGACLRAIGPFYGGMMTEYDWLSKKLLNASDRTGDRLWPMPLHDDWAPALKSSVADFTNLGSSKYYAGATTAGLFLRNFVGDTPWAHLDIAGPSFNMPDIPYYREGATGVGVRVLVDMIMNWRS